MTRNTVADTEIAREIAREIAPGDTFKGIALFTPGGDLAYCIDPEKHNRWHLQLCMVLQEMLGLPEPPHFLVPCYTATIDRWRDPQTQQLKTFAEAGPFVLRYQSLLNVLFGTGNLTWTMTVGLEDFCDPVMLNAYRKQFPALWEQHNLVIKLSQSFPTSSPNNTDHLNQSWSSLTSAQETQGYVMRLFVSNMGSGTERILRDLHLLLEQTLKQPYTLKVIDIHKHPDLAELDQVAATPTLLKVWPPPTRRIVGNLEDTSRIIEILTTVESPGWI
jgi:circadian clock protein KaiB